MNRRKFKRTGRRVPLSGSNLQLMDFSVGGTYTRTGNTFYNTSPSTLAVSNAGFRRMDARTGDGAYYLSELSRSNNALRSNAFDNASWTKTNCTVSADSTVAPDGTTSADTVTVTASGVAATVTQSIAVAGNQYWSIWAKQGTTSQTCSITITDGVTTQNLDFTPTSTWTRYSVRGTGFTNPITVIVRPHSAAGTGTAGDDVIIWGAQSETGTVMSVNKTTLGVGATGGEDQLIYASGQWPTYMATGRWLAVIRPCGDSTELNLTSVLYSFGGVNDELLILNTDQIRVVAGGVTAVTSGVLTWNKNTSRIFIYLNPAAGSITIAGAVTGNGTTVGSAWAWPTGVTLGVGKRNTVANTAPFCRLENPVIW